MTEEWKKTIYSDVHEVSSLGRVRTIGRRVKTVYGATRFVSGKIISGHKMTNTGYIQVILAGRVKQSAHRMIAQAFCPGFNEDLQVNHKNGVRDDNRPSNLEWVTQGQNNEHSYRVLGRVAPSKGKTSRDHPTSKAIISTNIKTGQEIGYECALDAVRSNPKFDSGAISKCCHGKQSFHKGYRFRFSDQISAFGAQHGVAFKVDGELPMKEIAA